MRGGRDFGRDADRLRQGPGPLAGVFGRDRGHDRRDDQHPGHRRAGRADRPIRAREPRTACCVTSTYKARIMLPERIGVFLALAAAICLPLAGARRRAARALLLRARGELVIGLPTRRRRSLAQDPHARWPGRGGCREAGPEPGPAVQPAPVDRGRSRPRAGLGTGGSGAGRARGRRGRRRRSGAQLAWQGTGYAVRPRRSFAAIRACAAAPTTRGRRVYGAGDAAQGAGARLAEVRTYRVPSDALVAVREGDCDVGLIDDALWEPLMRFPEWKKFSSTLAAEGRAPNGRGWCPPRRRPTAPGWPPKCAPGTAPAPGRRWPLGARDGLRRTWTRKCRTTVRERAGR